MGHAVRAGEVCFLGNEKIRQTLIMSDEMAPPARAGGSRRDVLAGEDKILAEVAIEGNCRANFDFCKTSFVFAQSAESQLGSLRA